MRAEDPPEDPPEDVFFRICTMDGPTDSSFSVFLSCVCQTCSRMELVVFTLDAVDDDWCCFIVDTSGPCAAEGQLSIRNRRT